MEGEKKTDEEEADEVEDTHDDGENPERSLPSLLRDFSNQIIQDNARIISEKNKQQSEQGQKLEVVFYADAVVNPLAVMVKFLNTLVAFFTMEGLSRPVSLAYRTHQPMFRLLELFLFHDRTPVLKVHRVSRIDDRNSEPTQKYQTSHENLSENKCQPGGPVLKMQDHNKIL